MGSDFTFRRLKFATTDSQGFPVSALSDFSVEVAENQSVAILKNGKFCNAFQVGDKARYTLSTHPTVLRIGSLIGVNAKMVNIAALGNDGNIWTHHLPMVQFCQLNESFDQLSPKNLKGFESL